MVWFIRGGGTVGGMLTFTVKSIKMVASSCMVWTVRSMSCDNSRFISSSILRK